MGHKALCPMSQCAIHDFDIQNKTVTMWPCRCGLPARRNLAQIPHRGRLYIQDNFVAHFQRNQILAELR